MRDEFGGEGARGDVDEVVGDGGAGLEEAELQAGRDGGVGGVGYVGGVSDFDAVVAEGVGVGYGEGAGGGEAG